MDVVTHGIIVMFPHAFLFLMVIVMYLRLREGRIQVAKRIALLAPMTWLYWRWFFDNLPFLRAPTNLMAFVTFTMSMAGYTTVVMRLYPEPANSREGLK
ncbi:hypothetical protein [Thermococcus sp. ES12]|uniref:hypothetical protein n=1 Tax=Thermococcus sp. ES12 TaxID=1638246 RepID=UPI00142FD7CF|nr:hypothetical protein [Thermococcus sp. ES12]NJE76755.1 hypothetical protein [Thermococcus sp. ES12]